MNSWLVYIPPDRRSEKALQYDFREIRDSEIDRFTILADAGSQSTIVLGCTAAIFYNALPYPCQFDVFLEKDVRLKLILLHHYQKHAPVAASFSIHLAESAALDWMACSLDKPSALLPESCTFADNTTTCQFTTFAPLESAEQAFILKKGRISQIGTIQNEEKEIALEMPDQAQLFYLQSRGIGKTAAKNLLTLSAIHDIIEQLPPAYAVEVSAFLQSKIQ